MTRLELDDTESRLLLRVLGETLSDLRMEIVDTDQQDYRNHLKREARTLEEIVRRLEWLEEQSQAPPV